MRRRTKSETSARSWRQTLTIMFGGNILGSYLGTRDIYVHRYYISGDRVSCTDADTIINLFTRKTNSLMKYLRPSRTEFVSLSVCDKTLTSRLAGQPETR